QPLTEQRARLVDPGRVDEHDLHLGTGEHPPHLRARRLGLVGDDRDLRPEHCVEQRGLADVGTSDERAEAGPHEAFFVIAIRPMPRPVTFSARSRTPSTSATSPSTGTWPRRPMSRPPTESQSPSGSSLSSTSLRSSMFMRALTLISPVGSSSSGCSSTSYSS